MAGVAFLLGAGGATWMRAERARAAPEQPLAFPHQPHVENQIDCSFCHEHYEDQAAAGMPRLTLCVTCHEAMPREDPETVKLFGYADEGKEIPWVKLYDLPDYSHFTHKWHVRAGIECATCHGDIGQSMFPVRHMVYKMAWCVDCHTREQAATDCVACHK